MTISMMIDSSPDSSGTQTPSSYYSLSLSSTGPPSAIFTPSTSLSTSPTSPSCTAKHSDNDDDGSFPDFRLDPRTFFPPVPDSGIPSKVDELDVNTPDRWVKRDSRLVRLTGKHPFNAEARIETLYAAGFLTPVSLFYVRNHGAVPNIPTFSSASPSPLSLPATEDIYPSIPPQLHVHSTWNIRIHGVVQQEQSFTINDLKRLFKVVTLPITLVCAGNRRKEQNVASKTLGFNWGAAGLSTALFTGVYLCDVLKYVRPLRHVLAASTSAPYIGVAVGNNNGNTTGNDGVGGHVIFEGADDDLPNGPYGTSQPLRWAMNKDKGMLLAWKMNGHDLEPDHGFPIRVVIPGQIGGRSVKWLRRIEISTRESQHHLHFRDNKVLPTQITAQRARDEPKWWYDPKYIIRDLNVNSAIAAPTHNETLHVPPPPPKAPVEPEEGGPYCPSGSESNYTLRGYAYAGGGKRVTIVEISLDEGESWEPADVTWPEDMYRAIAMDDDVYGELDLTDRDSCFCWCFWSFEVSIHELAASASIFVRAMDDSLALQPRDMYWNATGMMNNWWFRVAIHHEQGSDEDGGKVLRFEHPTLAGVASGGWMERMKTSGLDFLNPRFGDTSASPSTNTTTSQTTAEAKSTLPIMTNPDVKRQISMAEYTQQSSSSASPSQRKAMFVVNGEVYDATPFLNEHPGGADSIWLAAGEPDASEDFLAIHSDDAKRKLVPFHIGTLLNEEKANNVADSAEEVPLHDRVFLDKRKWQAVTLASMTAASQDSFIYSFALSSPDLAPGLCVGQHVFVRLRRKTPGGDMVQRAYTPLSSPDAKGRIDLLVKLYLPSASFPSGGKMTVGFHELVVGDSVEMKGPLGSFIWEGREGGNAGNLIRWKDVPRPGIRKLGMICGGSGITPIFQVLRAALEQYDNYSEDEDDQEGVETEIWLLDANRTEQDILCRNELEEYYLRYGDGRRTITSGADDARPADGSQTQTKARFRMHHTLSNPPKHWPHGTGRITDVMLQKHLPSPSDDALVLVCGPDPMVNLSIKPGLQRLGWNLANSLVVF